MRRVSKKRAALMRQVGPWRQDFKAQIGQCEVCLQKKSPDHLDCHEIARGSNRSKAVDKPFAILAVDRRCHEILHVHNNVAFQLALLLISRPKDYNIQSYWKLTGRCWPSQEDVDDAVRRIQAGSGL